MSDELRSTLRVMMITAIGTLLTIAVLWMGGQVFLYCAKPDTPAPVVVPVAQSADSVLVVLEETSYYFAHQGKQRQVFFLPDSVEFPD